MFQEPLKRSKGKGPMNWNHLLELMFWQAPVFLELVQSVLGYVEWEKSTKITYHTITVFYAVVFRLEVCSEQA